MPKIQFTERRGMKVKRYIAESLSKSYWQGGFLDSLDVKTEWDNGGDRYANGNGDADMKLLMRSPLSLKHAI